MNLLNETEKIGGLTGIAWAAVKHDMGSFVLKPNYDKEAKEYFLSFLDLDLTYCSVEGIIVYKDGSWLERHYDDGCDCGWVLKRTPIYTPNIANNVNKKWDEYLKNYENYNEWEEESDWKCEMRNYFTAHLCEQWYDEWHDNN